MDRKEARKMDPFTHYALVSAQEAYLDAGLDSDTINPDRVGVIWGSGIGGLRSFWMKPLLLPVVMVPLVSVFLYPDDDIGYCLWPYLYPLRVQRTEFYNGICLCIS